VTIPEYAFPESSRGRRVWRGDHVSAAQQFGVDWEGPSHSVMHAATFEAPKPSGVQAQAANPRRLSAVRHLLGCLFSSHEAWICVGWTLAWLAWLAWK